MGISSSVVCNYSISFWGLYYFLLANENNYPSPPSPVFWEYFCRAHIPLPLFIWGSLLSYHMSAWKCDVGQSLYEYLWIITLVKAAEVSPRNGNSNSNCYNNSQKAAQWSPIVWQSESVCWTIMFLIKTEELTEGIKWYGPPGYQSGLSSAMYKSKFKLAVA